MMMRLVLLLLSGLWLTHGRAIYPVIAREGRSLAQNTSPPPDDFEVISFDGDLDRITELALEKAFELENAPSSAPTITPSPTDSPRPSDAPSLTPSAAPTGTAVPSATPTGSTQPTTSESPTMAPVYETPSLIQCPEASLGQFETVTWQYSIETITVSPIFGFAQPGVARLLMELEDRLSLELVPELLPCWEPAEMLDTGVEALDSLPRDVVNSDDSCTPLASGNTCTVVDGRMNIFLESPEDADTGIYETRLAIQEILNDPEFWATIDGLERATYLGPDPTVPPNIVDPPDQDLGNSGGTLGKTSLVLVAIGSAAIVVFVGSVYYWRRDRSRTMDGAATQAAGSSINETSSIFYSSSHRPPSPFSEMLPKAYQLSENNSILSRVQVDTIGEEGDSPHQDNDSAILVSEGGYTTEGDESTAGGSLENIHKNLYSSSTHQQQQSSMMGARSLNQTNDVSLDDEMVHVPLDDHPDMLGPSPVSTNQSNDDSYFA